MEKFLECSAELVYNPPMTPEQCRAARALLRWSQADLSNAAGIGFRTTSYFEARGKQPTTQENRDALRAALERAGIVFTDDESQGVALRKRRPK
jgi:DNA-binding transcriptional regulator YiaG